MSDTVKLNQCPKCGAPIPAEAPQGLCPKCVLVGAATATEAGVPATATSEIPSLERVAAAFPQLEVLELIGRGGMGFVFKARQPHLDRFVALKLLPDKLARDPRFAERFNREGRVLARLNHPNIVSVYDFGQTEHFYFLLMEFVDGVNLRQAMKAGRFSPGEALAIVPKICEALQYAHGQGILHRDIKPENILLDARGHVKIADFGIAKLVGEEKPDVALTATGASLGTPHYMAPEQLEQPLTVDHRADIYSLGVVFYEMLTGELPIGRFAAPSSKTPVGTAVDEVVFRTLEKDRERRYQSAGEVKTQVEHLADADVRAHHSAESRPPVDNSLVARPAKALLAAGVFNWVASIVVVCLLAFTNMSHAWPITASELAFVCVLILVLSTLIIVGALKMLRLESYPLAILGSVLAMITSPGSIVGLPVGIWALVTLRQPKVRAAFLQNRHVETPPKLQVAGTAIPGWSHKAVWGAVLTGLSIPLPLLMAVMVYFRLGGLAGVELAIGAGSIGLPGLVGTILGWMALSDIRAHQGRLRGLPLAVFAALAYPLLMLLGATLVIPWVLIPLGGGGGHGTTKPLAGLLLLLIPIGLMTFGIWAVYAATRWGANKPLMRRRGVLKWVFLGLAFAAIGGLAALNFLQGKASNEADAATDGRSERAIDQNLRSIPDPIRINLRGAPGQVVAFQINRWDGGGPSPLPGFAGCYRMPDNRPSGFSVVLNPQSLGNGQPRRWDISAIPEDGPVARGGSLPLGNLRRALPTNSVSVVPPSSSIAVTLTENVVQTAGLDPIPQLTIDVFSTASSQEFPDQSSIRLGSTNWGQGLSTAVNGDAMPWIRFTFTAVELREIAGVRWLAIDYVDDVHGDCQTSFPWETSIPGFKAETRGSQFVKEDKDSPVVRHQRIEYRMPASSPREQLDRLRENLEKALKRKSIRLELSEQQAPVLLFELPGAEGGSLKAWVKVVPPLKISTDAASASFGPVVESALALSKAIDLASSRTKFMPAAMVNRPDSAENDTGICNWLGRERTDLAFSARNLLHGNMQDVVTLGRDDWNNVSPAQLGASLHPIGRDVPFKLNIDDARMYTYGFKTRDGRLGLLQFTNLADNPPGVQIRYKLSQEVKVVPPLNVPPAPASANSDPKHPNASAELWSPKLAPGEKPNLNDILQEARSLAQEGRNEEALQRHIWYHNHALETDPAQAGVRLSFALSYWNELARHYPKAQEALVEIRDRGEREFGGRGGDVELFSEISAINGYLGRKDATLALFKSIVSRNFQLARQCYRSAEELLVEAGDYALCARFVPDAQKRFESIREVRDRMLKLVDRTPSVNQALLRQQAERTFVKDSRQLVEILVGTGRKAEAEQIRDQAVAVLDIPELQSAVTDAEQKVASRSPPAR